MLSTKSGSRTDTGLYTIRAQNAAGQRDIKVYIAVVGMCFPIYPHV